jgi:NAD(P)-dependent dehydrogenase (short-subunit alcohol dehydrogenase family)
MTIFNLQNRVAFITGGNGGIGLGMAKGLAAAGASVVIAGRHKAKPQSAISAFARRLDRVCGSGRSEGGILASRSSMRLSDLVVSTS